MSLLRTSSLCLLPLLATVLASPRTAPLSTPHALAMTAPPFHPHFPKTLQCEISKELTVTVHYQTVTFDAQGAEKMPAGQAWHLAGATFETTGDLVVGGQSVKAGKWALSARKTKDGKWELVLHEGSGFSTKIPADAHVLTTELVADAPRYEHLNIDVQPAGDKEHTRLQLVVHFDQLMATASIELPK